MKFEHSKSTPKKKSTLIERSANADENKVKAKKPDVKREIFTWIETLLFSLIAVSLINTFVIRMTPVDGESMMPTLQNKDRIITTSIHGGYKHGDIITARRKDDTPIVKRIIAMEGDKIDIDFENGNVYLNDKLLDEPFIAEPTKNSENFSGPITIPKGYVFVMGDNRNFSDDSRNSKIGLIDERNIFGKVIFRIYPFGTFGTLK